MTTDELRKINQETLASWANKLTESHAVPFCLVGAGLDHNDGISFFVTLKNTPVVSELCRFLRSVADDLEREQG